jgi:hypothetical protein
MYQDTYCYTLLTKILANKECTVPVIVNSDPSTKVAAKVNNRNTSHKVANGNCENKSKENKFIVTGDSNVRGCAHEISKFLEKEF